MHGLFQYDGYVVQFMNKVTDCICLSFLWLLCSVPVVTIGAATAALYYAMNKCVRRGQGGVWMTFWHGFRANFRQATLLWLILLGLYALLILCCGSAYLMCVNGYLPKEMFYFLLILLAVVSLWASFVFPYTAKFSNSIRQILKNCIFIALMNFPAALLHLALIPLSLAAVLFFPLSVVCVPGVYTLLSCYALEPVFRKYMTEEDRAREEELDKA